MKVKIHIGIVKFSGAIVFVITEVNNLIYHLLVGATLAAGDNPNFSTYKTVFTALLRSNISRKNIYISATDPLWKIVTEFLEGNPKWKLQEFNEENEQFLILTDEN